MKQYAILSLCLKRDNSNLLHCLSFDLRLPITPVLSSNFSNLLGNICGLNHTRAYSAQAHKADFNFRCDRDDNKKNETFTEQTETNTQGKS